MFNRPAWLEKYMQQKPRVKEQVTIIGNPIGKQTGYYTGAGANKTIEPRKPVMEDNINYHEGEFVVNAPIVNKMGRGNSRKGADAINEVLQQKMEAKQPINRGYQVGGLVRDLGEKLKETNIGKFGQAVSQTFSKDEQPSYVTQPRMTPVGPRGTIRNYAKDPKAPGIAEYLSGPTETNPEQNQAARTRNQMIAAQAGTTPTTTEQNRAIQTRNQMIAAQAGTTPTTTEQNRAIQTRNQMIAAQAGVAPTTIAQNRARQEQNKAAAAAKAGQMAEAATTTPEQNRAIQEQRRAVAAKAAEEGQMAEATASKTGLGLLTQEEKTILGNMPAGADRARILEMMGQSKTGEAQAALKAWNDAQQPAAAAPTPIAATTEEAAAPTEAQLGTPRVRRAIDRTMQLQQDIAEGRSPLIKALADQGFANLDAGTQGNLNATALRLASDPNMTEGARNAAMAEVMRDAGMARSDMAAKLAIQSMEMAQAGIDKLYGMAKDERLYSRNVFEANREFNENTRRWNTDFNYGLKRDMINDMFKSGDYDGVAKAWKELYEKDIDVSRLEDEANREDITNSDNALSSLAIKQTDFDDPQVQAELQRLAKGYNFTYTEEWGQKYYNNLKTISSSSYHIWDDWDDKELANFFRDSDTGEGWDISQFSWGGLTGADAARGAIDKLWQTGGLTVDSSGKVTFDQDIFDKIMGVGTEGDGETDVPSGFTAADFKEVDTVYTNAAGDKYKKTADGKYVKVDEITIPSGFKDTDFEDENVPVTRKGKTYYKDDDGNYIDMDTAAGDKTVMTIGDVDYVKRKSGWKDKDASLVSDDFTTDYTEVIDGYVKSGKDIITLNEYLKNPNYAKDADFVNADKDEITAITKTDSSGNEIKFIKQGSKWINEETAYENFNTVATEKGLNLNIDEWRESGSPAKYDSNTFREGSQYNPIKFGEKKPYETTANGAMKFLDGSTNQGYSVGNYIDTNEMPGFKLVGGKITLPQGKYKVINTNEATSLGLGESFAEIVSQFLYDPISKKVYPFKKADNIQADFFIAWLNNGNYNNGITVNNGG